MLITNKTRLNIVIGCPLNHTQSPALHNMIYQMLNIDAVLLAIEPIEVEAIIQSIKTLGIGLTAVTMPFKEKILPYLDQCSPEIKDLNSANTIIQHKDKLYGYNTDVDGIDHAFRNVVVASRQVLIIGAGGAARAAAFFFRKMQAKILWVNRTYKNALAIAKIFGGDVVHYSQLRNRSIDIIINTTPLGIFPDTECSPLPNYKFNQNQVVFDMVYNPINTKLLMDAKKDGAFTISGIEMLIGQGIRQVEIWSKKKIYKESTIAKLKENLVAQQYNYF